MAVLEYATVAVPKVVEKAVPSFFYSDPLFAAMKARGTVKRDGGTHIRFIRVKSGHSDVQEISGTNLQVTLARRETLSSMTGDWTKYIKPIILPRIELDRLDKAGKKRHIARIAMAATQSLKNDVCRRIYLFNTSTAALSGLGGLNGGTAAAVNASGTISGLQNGALMFSTPAAQAAGGATYLNEARVQDLVKDENNWHNQHVTHGGIGVDCLESIEEVKMLADSYSEDNEGISMGVMGVQDHIALGREVRSYPGGSNASAVVYTADDLAQGKAHKTVWHAGGVNYYSNRWITGAALGAYAGGSAIVEPIILLNANYVEWWVNAGNDFRTTAFKYMLETTGFDADVAFINLETQFAVPGLLQNGTVSG